jgi:hypothetical protein
MCFVFIWEQTATCVTYIIYWLVFITELKSVYSAVRTGPLNETASINVRSQYLWHLSEVQTSDHILGTYRVIKKFLFTWWSQYRKLQVMFKVSPADRQGQGDTRLTLMSSVIPNSNYVIMVSDWKCSKYFCMFFYTVIIRCTDFLITLYFSLT